MEKKKILLVGGYGTVGSVVAEILAKDERVSLVICGRNESKAKELAFRLGTEWCIADIRDESSITPALDGIDILINCFSGPFTGLPLLLPGLAMQRGIHYMDVSGSFEYAERFLRLHDDALRNKVAMITALGANPGIPGIALMSIGEDFDVFESGRIVFVLGSRLEGVSAPALKELKYMFDVKPLIWKESRWEELKGMGDKEYVGEPFNRQVYLGGSLTYDLLAIPRLTGIGELSFWSGSQNDLQGLAMILGLKMGFTNSDRGARFLLNLLKRLGGKGAIPDALFRITASGRQQNGLQKKLVEMYCEENYATALAPVIVCQQLIEGKITRAGAFTPPEIVPASDFMQRLRRYPVHYAERVEKDY